jgi:hypothetical protein
MRVRGTLLSTVAFLAVAMAAASQAPAPPAKPAPRAPAAKPTPPPPPVLEGVVRGPDRKPIEKALVAALPSGPALGGRMDRPNAVSTLTDANGRFRLTLPTREPHTVRAEAKGLAAATRRDVVAGTPLTFDLRTGGTIEGTVRDGDTGQPVAGLRVTAGQSGSFPVDGHPNAGRVTATTDANGRFQLQGLAGGRHLVSASGRGRGAASRSGVALGSRIDLLVFPSGSVFGTVLGPNGQPVPGATVSLNARPFGWSLSEEVDAKGAFEVNGVSAGLFDVVARAPGMAPAVTAEVGIDRRSEVRLDLRLGPGARVVGRLLDANERPVGGRVSIGDLSGQAVPRVIADALKAEAGADGRFAIEAVPPGEHALGAVASGHAAERVEVAVRDGERVVEVGDVRLSVGHAIRGRVRAKAGPPIADAVVRATAGRSMMMGGGIEARSEADGSFVLAGVEPTVSSVTVEAPGFALQEKTAEPGGEPLEFVLDPAGTIQGVVVDERSRPVESFRVAARTGRSEVMRFRMPVATEVVTDDGRFTLSNVAPGTYVVTVTAPELASANVADVKVAEGQVVDVGTVKLTAGGLVRGTVVDATGAGVGGASVSIIPPPQSFATAGMPTPATSESSGAFELRGVAEGAVDVSATHPNYASAEPVTVQVDARKPVTDVRLVLSLGGRIEGSVRKRDGSGRAGLMVSSNAIGPTRTPFGAGASATTGGDGSFVLEHVPAGRVNLMVFSRLGGPMSAGSRRTVEVRDGETTTVDIVDREILVSGRVTRSGAPGSGLRLDASSASGTIFMSGFAQGAPAARDAGPQRMTASTREDGSFEMLVDEPGTYHLNVSSTDGKVRLPMRTIEVPDAEAHAVEISYEGASVTGVVIDQETEAPVAHAGVGASGKGGARVHAGGMTGADGRFQLELEPGEYRLSASARQGGYGSAETDITVGPGGLADLRLALPKGLAIAGRVTDAAGRPQGGINVRATATAGPAGMGGFAQSLADGSFEMTGLKEGSYTLTAEGEHGTFAIRPGVASGSRNVALALQPGGRLSVTVTGPDGAGVAEAWPSVTRVNGLFVGYLSRPIGPTDAQGRTEVLVPAGDLVLWASKEPLGGGATASVAPGQTVAVTVRMTPGGKPPEN